MHICSGPTVVMPYQTEIHTPAYTVSNLLIRFQPSVDESRAECMVSWRQAETSYFWWRIYPNVTPVADHAWSDVCDDFDGLACQAEHGCAEFT